MRNKANRPTLIVIMVSHLVSDANVHSEIDHPFVVDLKFDVDLTFPLPKNADEIYITVWAYMHDRIDEKCQFHCWRKPEHPEETNV